MLLQEVIIEDFLSIAKATISFPESGLVHVTGWDETLGRANGAGKSTIMQAISWCLYSEFPRDVKVEELIRRGQPSCSVTVKAIFGDHEWVITRKRPVDFVIYVDGKKVKGNPKLLQSLLEQEIGFNYKQFLVTSYSPQKGDASRFLNQKDSLAKEFLSVILNYSRVEQGYKKFHLEIKDKEVELSSAIVKFNTLVGSRDRLISFCSAPVPELPSKEEVLNTKNELELVKITLMNPPDTSAIDFEIDSLKKKQSAVSQAQGQAVTLSRRMSSLKSDIESLTTPDYMVCPSCEMHLIEKSQELIPFDDEAAEEVRQSKEDNLKKLMDETQSKIDECIKFIDSNPNISTLLDAALDKRSALKSDYLVAEQKKKTLESQMQSFKRMYDAFKQHQDQALKIQSQIDEVQLQVAEADEKIKDIESQIMIKTAAKQVLSPTGAIAYSLDSVIDDINSEVTAYLDIFSHGTMTYRMTSGEDKAKITHNVTYNGDDVSIGSLSGGEERGLIMSVDMGLSEVLAKRCGVPLPSILMLDECFEGLDYVGKEKIIDALKEISNNRCIMVIDHQTEMSSLFDHKIKVTKRGAVSSVEVE